MEHWTTYSSVRSFARTAHSFAGSALLASLVRSAALIRLLARLLTTELEGKRFLDAFSHLYKRVCLSVRRLIRPLVRRSVRPLVGPFVGRSVTHELSF